MITRDCIIRVEKKKKKREVNNSLMITRGYCDVLIFVLSMIVETMLLVYFFFFQKFVIQGREIIKIVDAAFNNLFDITCEWEHFEFCTVIKSV